MNQKIHYADFHSIRSSYLEVKSFIETEYWGPVKSLKTSIDKDLRIAGDDNLELLEKFVSKYQLDYAEFDYSKHFLSEGELFGSGMVIFQLLVLPVVILFWAIKLISFGRLNFTKPMLFPDSERETLDLTFGDLVIWHLTGRYNLRRNTIIAFQKSA